MSEGISPGLDRKRRVPLVHAPTPFEPLKGLSRQLGGPEIWIKRDDCTGLALGGNKARKLEFLVAEARGVGADTLVTVGARQSNHVRLTGAAARVCGMEALALVFDEDGSDPQGNQLLDELFGMEVVDLGLRFEETTPESLERQVSTHLERLRGAGRAPFYIPPGGATPLGALAYFRATEELAHQARKGGCDVTAIVVPVGTAGTLAGLLLGVDALRLGWKVVGISSAPEGAWERTGIPDCDGLARGAAGLLGLDYRLSGDAWEILYEYVGEGYGAVSPGSADAIRTLARSDGILLDPVYTGKAMAGLIDLVAKGRFTRDDKVVFLHTGGTPALFAHPEIARPAEARRG
jgi:D-cysteine desulfhydrase family pyridoxal phosphate-dependent enzyme